MAMKSDPFEPLRSQPLRNSHPQRTEVTYMLGIHWLAQLELRVGWWFVDGCSITCKGNWIMTRLRHTGLSFGHMLLLASSSSLWRWHSAKHARLRGSKIRLQQTRKQHRYLEMVLKTGSQRRRDQNCWLCCQKLARKVGSLWSISAFYSHWMPLLPVLRLCKYLPFLLLICH